MNIVKSTYLNGKAKRTVREFLISKFKFETVVGLAGPDINEYIEYMSSKGCKNFEIFENHPDIIVKQLSTLNTTANVTLKYDDIIKAESDKPNTLFDLDFCITVKSLKEHIKSFKNNFIMTFSVRFGIEKTIIEFFKEREENIFSRKSIFSPLYHTIINTDKGKYIFITYKDTSPMCCFAKIK